MGEEGTTTTAPAPGGLTPEITTSNSQANEASSTSNAFGQPDLGGLPSPQEAVAAAEAITQQAATPIETTTPESTTPPPSPDFSYSNTTTGETGINNQTIATQVDTEMDSHEDPNPGFDNPIAVATPTPTVADAPLQPTLSSTTEGKSRNMYGLSDADALKVGTERNEYKSLAIDPSAANSSEASETNHIPTLAEIRQITRGLENNPQAQNKLAEELSNGDEAKKKKILKLISPIVLLASAFLNDGGNSGASAVNPDGSPMSDQQIVDLNDKMRSVITDGAQSLDGSSSTLEASEKAIDDLNKSLNGGSSSDPTETAAAGPVQPRTEGPNGEPIPVAPKAGGGVSEAFKNTMADAAQGTVDQNVIDPLSTSPAPTS